MSEKLAKEEKMLLTFDLKTISDRINEPERRDLAPADGFYTTAFRKAVMSEHPTNAPLVRQCLRCGIVLAGKRQRKFCSSACSNIFRCCGATPPNARNDQDIRSILWEQRIVKTESGCWEWQGNRPDGRYGMIGYLGKYWLTHRLSYFLFTGEHPGERLIMHSCDNPPCVNPAHLVIGTNMDNSADMVAKGRSCKGKKRPGTGPAGDRNVKAKLTVEQVEQIRRDYKSGHFTYRQLASQYGIGKSQVCNIVRYHQWEDRSRD